MDLNKIKEYAKGYEKDMTAFLRAIVKNPGESCDEMLWDSWELATRSSHLTHISIQ